MDHPIGDLMQTTLENIKDMVDVNTVIGEPIPTVNGPTIIPVSRVSFGFLAGGGEYDLNKLPETDTPFAGGGGAGAQAGVFGPAVHEDESGAGGGDERGHVRIGEGGDVVDDRRAEVERGARDGGVAGVDGEDRGGKGRAQGAQDGEETAQLLVRRDGGEAGAGRFGADVEAVGAVGEQARGAGDGGLGGGVEAAVGEGVRRRVEDAEQRGAALGGGAREEAGEERRHGANDSTAGRRFEAVFAHTFLLQRTGLMV